VDVPFAVAACQGRPVIAVASVAADVRIVRHIDEVSAAEWNSIVPVDDVQTSHAFVRACQDSGVENAKYWHVLVYRAGELAGIATLSLVDIPLDLLSTGFTRQVIGAVRRVRPALLRPAVLLCGLPVSAGRPCLAIRSPADAPFVLRAIAEAMEQVGAEADADLCCVKEFTDAEAFVMNGLEPHGFFRAASLPSFRLDIPWPTFDAYLAGMRAGYRRQALATLRARDSSGLRVRRVADYASQCPGIFALYEQVISRAEFRLERLNLPFFRHLAAYLADSTSAVLVEQDDRLVAAAILLRSPNVLTFFMTGIDYSRNRGCSAYLNLVLEIIAEAIRTRASAVELGQTSGALKSRLGARAEARHLYFRCPSTLSHAAFRSTSSVLFPRIVPPVRRVFRTGAHADG
jgi:predicted N-acyltransferase